MLGKCVAGGNVVVVVLPSSCSFLLMVDEVGPHNDVWMVLKDSVSNIDFYGPKHTYDFTAETHLSDGAFCLTLFSHSPCVANIGCALIGVKCKLAP